MTSKRSPGSKALKAYSTWALVLHWKILFGEQIHNCSNVFLFNKLTYKSLSNTLTSCIHPFVLISSSRKCSFCGKMSEEATLPVKTAHYQMKGRAWRWPFWRVFEALVFKESFHQANVFNLNFFVSVTVFLPNLIVSFFFYFWHQK